MQYTEILLKGGKICAKNNVNGTGANFSSLLLLIIDDNMDMHIWIKQIFKNL
jgi:hypothetical protein